MARCAGRAQQRYTAALMSAESKRFLPACAAIGGLALLVACSGSQKTGPTLPAPPDRLTRATLVGPLCHGTECRCADTPAQAGPPPSSAVKRYEVVIGPVDNEMWTTIGDNVLYKSTERATECFYLDLPAPGDVPVTVRAHGRAGYGAHVAIHELRADGKGRYDTFDFICGAPGVCRMDQIEAWQQSLDHYPRGIHDPCGSTKIERVHWDTGRLADIHVPNDLYLTFAMKIYPFAPKAPHGDPRCANKY